LDGTDYHFEVLNSKCFSDISDLDVAILTAPSELEGGIEILCVLLDRRPHVLGEFVLPS
jgi:hypothetical protein